MKRSAAPDTRNSRVSRQGPVARIASASQLNVWRLCMCQSHGA